MENMASLLRLQSIVAEIIILQKVRETLRCLKNSEKVELQIKRKVEIFFE